MFCTNCGAQNADAAAHCVTCGSALRRTSGLRQVGNELVVPQGAALPPYCVKCGQPATQWVKKNFSWHAPWVLVLVLLNLLIYLIVALAISKRQKLDVPLCDAHYRKRRTQLLAGWGLLIGAIPAGMIVGSTGGDDMAGLGFLLGFAMVIASLVFLAIASRPLKPKLIDAGEGRYGGVSAAFLQIAVAQGKATGAGQ